MDNRANAGHGVSPITFVVFTIVILAGILYWFIWNDAPILSLDSMDYMDIAVDLQDGELDDIYFRAPGYPLLLVLADSANKPSRMLYFIQLSLHLISVALLALFLIRLEVPRIPIGFFLVLSLLPMNVVMTAYVLTEALTEFFLVIGAVMLLFWLDRGSSSIRVLFLVVSGVAFGLLALVRPSYQLLFVVLAVIMLLLYRLVRAEKRKWLLAMTVTFIVPLLIIGGYYAYNYNKFGYFGLTPSFGFHLSTKTARVVERLPDEYAEVREVLVRNRDIILVERNGRHTGENYIWLAVPELERITGLDKPGLSNYLLRLNLILIKQAPLYYLKDVTSAASLYWFPTTTRLSNFNSRSIQLLWSVIHFIVISIYFMVVFLLACFILLRWLLPDEVRRKMFPALGNIGIMLPSFAIPFTIIVYSMLVSTMFEAGHQRYRTPTDLLIFFFLILGIHFSRGVRSASKKLCRAQGE